MCTNSLCHFFFRHRYSVQVYVSNNGTVDSRYKAPAYKAISAYKAFEKNPGSCSVVLSILALKHFHSKA